MSFLDQIKKIVRSRKFWVLVAAIVATLSAYLTSEIDVWQGLQALMTAEAGMMTGIAAAAAAPGSTDMQQIWPASQQPLLERALRRAGVRRTLSAVEKLRT